MSFDRTARQQLAEMHADLLREEAEARLNEVLDARAAQHRGKVARAAKAKAATVKAKTATFIAREAERAATRERQREQVRKSFEQTAKALHIPL